MPFKLAFLVIIVSVVYASSEGLQNKSEALLRSVLIGTDSIHYKKITISDSLQNHIHSLTGTYFDDRVIEVFIAYRSTAILGFGLMDMVQSKSSVLSFLLITDTTGEIQGVELLVTPDPRSAKLRSPLWKNQFVGKKEIKSRQIDAMSGATLSSRDITQGVIRLLLYLRLTGNII